MVREPVQEWYHMRYHFRQPYGKTSAVLTWLVWLLVVLRRTWTGVDGRRVKNRVAIVQPRGLPV